MRRKEKEITDKNVIEGILRKSRICTIALNDLGSPHIIPINYGYSNNHLYFHSAPEGRKIRLLRGNREASFTIEDFHQILADDVPCGWTTEYRSLMGTGKIEIIDEPAEKRKGLDIIMTHHGNAGEHNYLDSQIDKVVILKLSIASVTCKQSGDAVRERSHGMALLEQAKELKALSETGLIYHENLFDRERYSRIRELSINMMASITNKEPEVISSFYGEVKDYPTPKVDIRGMVINAKGEVLMVREQSDGKWTIPGGWADIGCSPSEVAVREIWEEAGLVVKANRLLAVYDKRCHAHPPSPYYVYKLVFHCVQTEGQLQPGFDILDTGWFSIDKLPELSTDRVLAEQVKELWEIIESDSSVVIFD